MAVLANAFHQFESPAKLAAFDASRTPNATFARCSVVNDNYVLQLNASAAEVAAADSVNIILCAAPANAIWKRLYVQNIAAQFEPAWFIDGAAGNDANDGITSLTPLKTLSELSHRLRGATIFQLTTVHITAGTYSGLNLDVTVALNKRITLECAITSSANHTIISHTVCSPTTNVPAAFVTADNVFASKQRLRLVAPAAQAGSMSSVQAPTVGTSTSPTVAQWYNPVTDATVEPTDGNDVVIDTRTVTLNSGEIRNAGAGFVFIQDAILTGNWLSHPSAVSTARTTIFQGCDCSGSFFEMSLSQCVLRGGVVSATNAHFSQCDMFVHGTAIYGSCFVERGSEMQYVNGAIDGGTLRASGGGYISSTSGNIQIVNCTVGPAIAAQNLGQWNFQTPTIWGTVNNTANIFRAFTGGGLIYGITASIVCTTTGTLIFVAAVAKTLGTLPAGDATRGAFMGNSQ
jgi:hypothetical protein